MPPISERHPFINSTARCAFLGTYAHFNQFRRWTRDAEPFKYVGEYKDTLGREFDYVIVDTYLTPEQDYTLQNIRIHNPNVEVHLYARDVLDMFPVPLMVQVSDGWEHCMWCGREFGPEDIEAHEAVCGA